jgi:large subunit ribosomal protein L20
MKQAKGFFGRRKTFGQLQNAVEKAMCYAYRDRKVNKRNFRALWIQRINAGARLKECLIHNSWVKKKNNIELNRKVL